MLALKRGILLAIEGIDGSGKTTLAKNLYNYLHTNYPAILTKEPGATSLGKILRSIVQEQKFSICPEAEFLLFSSDRAQHFKEIIIPALERNEIIISDRMADSSLVYQGYARGLDLQIIQTINKWVMQNIYPDLTFYVRVSASVAKKRIQERNQELTAFEKEKEEFIQKLINGFETIYKNQKNVFILDGNQPIEQVSADAITMITQWIEKNRLIS